jgi:hypothetical protein
VNSFAPSFGLDGILASPSGEEGCLGDQLIALVIFQER